MVITESESRLWSKNPIFSLTFFVVSGAAKDWPPMVFHLPDCETVWDDLMAAGLLAETGLRGGLDGNLVGGFEGDWIVTSSSCY